MRNLLIFLLVFAVAYAMYYMYILLQAKDGQVSALKDQLLSTQKYLNNSEANNKVVLDSLKSANKANQKLQTTGGSIEAFFSNIF